MAVMMIPRCQNASSSNEESHGWDVSFSVQASSPESFFPFNTIYGKINGLFQNTGRKFCFFSDGLIILKTLRFGSKLREG
jgi:hypothetical protein